MKTLRDESYSSVDVAQPDLEGRGPHRRGHPHRHRALQRDDDTRSTSGAPSPSSAPPACAGPSPTSCCDRSSTRAAIRCRPAPRPIWKDADRKARLCVALAPEHAVDPFDGYLAGLLHNTGWTAALRAIDGFTDLPIGAADLLIPSSRPRSCTAATRSSVRWSSRGSSAPRSTGSPPRSAVSASAPPSRRSASPCAMPIASPPCARSRRHPALRADQRHRVRPCHTRHGAKSPVELGLLALALGDQQAMQLPAKPAHTSRCAPAGRRRARRDRRPGASASSPAGHSSEPEPGADHQQIAITGPDPLLVELPHPVDLAGDLARRRCPAEHVPGDRPQRLSGASDVRAVAPRGSVAVPDCHGDAGRRPCLDGRNAGGQAAARSRGHRWRHWRAEARAS